MHLVETEQGFFANEKSLVLLSEGEAQCGFTMYPPLNGRLKLASVGELHAGRQGGLIRFTASVPEVHPSLEIKNLKDSGEVPPVELGPRLLWRTKRVMAAPDDADFELAKKWSITLPRTAQSDSISTLFLSINYTGDVARLSANGNLLDNRT